MVNVPFSPETLEPISPAQTLELAGIIANAIPDDAESFSQDEKNELLNLGHTVEEIIDPGIEERYVGYQLLDKAIHIYETSEQGSNTEFTLMVEKDIAGQLTQETYRVEPLTLKISVNRMHNLPHPSYTEEWRAESIQATESHALERSLGMDTVTQGEFHDLVMLLQQCNDETRLPATD